MPNSIKNPMAPRIIIIYILTLLLNLNKSRELCTHNKNPLSGVLAYAYLTLALNGLRSFRYGFDRAYAYYTYIYRKSKDDMWTTAGAVGLEPTRPDQSLAIFKTAVITVIPRSLIPTTQASHFATY